MCRTLSQTSDYVTLLGGVTGSIVGAPVPTNVRREGPLVSESTIDIASQPVRLVIAGGGSGGHVSPAVAVIEELRLRGPLEALWIGAKSEYEGVAARELGIAFQKIRAGKLRRYASFETIGDAFRIPAGTWSAWRSLRAFRPDVIFSTGG